MLWLVFEREYVSVVVLMVMVMVMVAPVSQGMPRGSPGVGALVEQWRGSQREAPSPPEVGSLEEGVIVGGLRGTVRDTPGL